MPVLGRVGDRFGKQRGFLRPRRDLGGRRRAEREIECVGDDAAHPAARAGVPFQPRTPPSVLSPFAQPRCYLRWGDVSAISSEGVTPRSSLLRAHVPLPLGSLLLRHLASFEESLQVVRSPCCPRELPDVISENLSLDAGSPTPAVHRVLSPVSSTVSSAFPTAKVGRLSASVPANYDFSQETSRGCRYSLM